MRKKVSLGIYHNGRMWLGVARTVGLRVCQRLPFRNTTQHHHCGRVTRRMNTLCKSPNDRKEYRVITLSNGLTALLISDTEVPGQHLLTTPPPLNLNAKEPRSGTDTEEEVAHSPAKKCKIRKKSSAQREKRSKPQIRSLIDAMHRSWNLEENASPPVLVYKHKMEVIMAAAALCIGVGSFCDPADIPGLTHFMEHMVFMGSRKYRKENAFDDFLAKHGGESNAWTDTERTTFFFDIYKEHFEKALDIFAHFFISPLFLKSSVDREIMAVDNEYQMLVPKDTDRFHQILATLASPGSPVGKFLCGNLKTLKTIPIDRGIDVYGRLKEYYKRFYSAQYMTLVVQAPESLDYLQDLVCDIFENIPNNNMWHPLCSPCTVEAFPLCNFHKLIKVIPVEDSHKLEVVWALQPLKKYFKEKPLEYLNLLITHEGPGSVMYYLRNKFWALSVTGGNSGGGYDHNTIWSGFIISIELTDAGLQNVSKVILVLFEYIHMLNLQGPQINIFKELQDLEVIKYRFKEEVDPLEHVELLVENMQMFPRDYYLNGRALMFTFDPQLLQECTSALSPSSACIALFTKNFIEEGTCNLTEPWFGAHYSITDIPPAWENEWKDLKENPELYLPAPNPFIPTDFDIKVVEHASEYPIQVFNNEFVRMWYKKDNKFRMPKGFIFLHLVFPSVSESAVDAALSDLFTNIVEQNLQSFLYAASLAGYGISFDCLSTGFVIQLEGFTHKLHMVLEAVVNQITDFTVTQDLFNAMKAQLKKGYYNQMIQPLEFVAILQFALIEPTNMPYPDRYNAVGDLTLDMLLNFHRKMLNSLYIESLVIGNYTPEEVVNMGQFIQDKMCKTPLPPDKRPKKRILQLPEGELQCRVRGVNPLDTNSCVTSYYQTGPGTIRTCCLNDLLAMRMKEPCFQRLRTELQLGYSVFCQPFISNGILGFSITVETQANKFSMTDIENHITEFMEDFEIILHKMTKSQYRELVEAVVTSKQVEDTQLGDEAGRFWNEIVEGYYIFNRLDLEVETLVTITQKELEEWYANYLDATHRHISFQVQGALTKPTKVSKTQKGSSNANTEIEKRKTTSPQDGDKEDFFKLLCDGSDFVKDVKEFRQTLPLYPYTLIIS